MITRLITALADHNHEDYEGVMWTLVDGVSYELAFKDKANYLAIIALGKMEAAVVANPRRLSQAALPSSGDAADEIDVGEMLICRVGVAEIQTVTSDVVATGGSWTLAFGADETDPIDWDADIDAISDALNLLDTIIAVGGVVVTGDDRTSTSATTITFLVTAEDVAQIASDDALLTGGAAITVTDATGTAGSTTSINLVFNDIHAGVVSAALS